MTLGSLFDGAGTVPFAAALCGIETLWSSEIEKFPLEVTAKRFPYVKQLGDITKIKGDEIEPVDIISFGSPCQDLSVAGKGAGLAGERSGLFMEAIRIIKEMRSKTNGRYPNYIIFENVPGIFSSNNGEDFRTVLEEFCKIKDSGAHVPRPTREEKCVWSDAGEIVGDGYSIAWRVLDAQFWGVPQRRRRVFLVADFGSECAGEILFEREGLSRHFKEIKSAWERTSEDIGNCSASADTETVCYKADDGRGGRIAPCLVGDHNNRITDHTALILEKNAPVTPVCNQGGIAVVEMRRSDDITQPIHAFSQNQREEIRDLENKAGSIMAEPGTHQQTYVVIEDSSENPNNSACIGFVGNMGSKANTIGCAEELAPTIAAGRVDNVCYSVSSDSSVLDYNEGNPTCNQGGNAIVRPIPIEGNGQRPSHKGDGYNEEEVSYTLNSTEVHGVAYQHNVINLNKDDVQSKQILDLDGIAPAIYSGECLGSGSEMHVIEPKENPVVYGIARDVVNSGKNAKIFTTIEENIQPTLTAQGPGAVGFYPQQKAEGMVPSIEKSPTLVNGTNPGLQNGVIENGYVVRRLTPTECARLQGMPDWWCADVPHTDSAEYKMWGNGMALPNMLYIMEGVAKAGAK